MLVWAAAGEAAASTNAAAARRAVRGSRMRSKGRIGCRISSTDLGPPTSAHKEQYDAKNKAGARFEPVLHEVSNTAPAWFVPAGRFILPSSHGPRRDRASLAYNGATQAGPAHEPGYAGCPRPGCSRGTGFRFPLWPARRAGRG